MSLRSSSSSTHWTIFVQCSLFLSVSGSGTSCLDPTCILIDRCCYCMPPESPLPVSVWRWLLPAIASSETRLTRRFTEPEWNSGTWVSIAQCCLSSVLSPIASPTRHSSLRPSLAASASVSVRVCPPFPCLTVSAASGGESLNEPDELATTRLPSRDE